jgi:hypothetical protein
MQLFWLWPFTLYTVLPVWSLTLNSLLNQELNRYIELHRVKDNMSGLHCYRLDYRASYDEELVWALVQRHGGHLSIGIDRIDFWIDPQWDIVLNMAFPDLVRRPELDYI